MAKAKRRAAPRKSGRRTPRRRMRDRWLGRRVILLGVLLLLLALALIWLLSPFWQLRDRLGAHEGREPSRLYGRSEVLRVGEPYGHGRLETELGLVGYREKSAGMLRPGEFRVSGATVEAHLREFPTPWGPNLGGPLEVRFRGGRVDRLIWRGEETPAVLLEPPLLASFYGADGG